MASEIAYIKTSLLEFSRNYAALALYLIYAACISVLFYSHEPWADEYVSWKRSTDMSSLKDFFILEGEGHPPLFYWLQRGLQTFLTFDQARYLSLLIALVNGLLISVMLQKNRIMTGLFLFSYPILFFWSVFFRSYGLALLFILAAASYSRRERYIPCAVFMFLSSFTHFLFFFLYPLFAAEEFLRHKSIRLFKYLVLPSLLCIGIVYLSGKSNHEIDILSDSAQFLPMYFDKTFGVQLLGDFSIAPMILISACLLMAFAPPLFAASVLAVVFSFVFFQTYVYGGYMHIAGIGIIMILIARLIHAGKIRDWLLAPALLCSIAVGLTFANFDLRHPYSNGGKMYDVIRQHNLQHLKIFAERADFLPSMMKHNVPFYLMPLGREANGKFSWGELEYSTARYKQCMEYAGNPDEFIFLRPTGEVPPLRQDDHKRNVYIMISMDKMADKMGWDYEFVTKVDGALFENAEIYIIKVRRDKKSGEPAPATAKD